MLEVFNTAFPCALSKEATVDICPKNLCKHCHSEVSNLTFTSFGHLVDRQYGFSSVFFGWIDGLHGNQRHPLGRILSVSKTPEHLELENVTRASFKKVVRNKWVKLLMLDELSLYLTNPLIYLV